MAESQEKFVANPKGKAPIWEFFCFRCKDGQVDSTKAYCTKCKASVKLGGGTSNMSAHVRRHHPLLLNKPFGKAKVTSVRNPPGPAPIDSTGAGPSASTNSDVDPLTNLSLSLSLFLSLSLSLSQSVCVVCVRKGGELECYAADRFDAK